MSLSSDFVFKHHHSEGNSQTNIVTKKYREQCRKRLKQCPYRKRMLAALTPTSIKCLSYNSTAVAGIISQDFDTKTFQTDGVNHVVKKWVLADCKRVKKSEIQRVNMLAWNEEAVKFETQLSKGTRVLILNFLVKSALTNRDRNDSTQSPYEIYFTSDTTYTIIG